MADALDRLPGSGIVYVLTVAETERLAGLLLSDAGFDVAAYSSAVATDEREALENRLRRNEVKALVATSALGMGFDKPDLAFCIHVGSPASPVAYYQQVGRAGRALDDAVAVLLPAAADERVWEYFATSGIPVPEHVDALLAALDGGAATVVAIESATKLRRGRIEALLKILAVDGVVSRGADGWTATGTPWTYDVAKWQALRRVREAEADLMRRLCGGRRVPDAVPPAGARRSEPGAVRSVLGVHRRASPPGTAPEPASMATALRYLRTLDVELEPRKLWPAGVRRSQGQDHRLRHRPSAGVRRRRGVGRRPGRSWRR